MKNILFLGYPREKISINWNVTPQHGKGSYHRSADLPKGVDWNADIDTCLRKLKESQ